MSVQPGPTLKRYAANGVTTVYTIPFLLLDAADLQITLDGAPVTTGFTLTGIGNPQSTCTFTAAPDGDLLFQMVMTFQRLTDYQTNGDFLSTTVNRDYDRLWLAIKQVNRDSGRALTVSLLEPEGIQSLPVKSMRASRVLAFDATGQPIVSNLTLEQIEQQPALSMEAAAQAALSASQALSSKNSAHLSELAAANSAAAALVSQGICETLAGDPWALLPIGMPVPVMAGAAEPPKDKSYRYIKLTYGDTYNTGAVNMEVISGSAPLVVANCRVAVSGSPIFGNTVYLINTERRSIRPGAAGSLQDDALQNITGAMNGSMSSASVVTPTGAFAKAGTPNYSSGADVAGRGYTDMTFDASRVARTDNETRIRNIGANFYMRVK